MAMDTQAHPLSLKVMRISRPSLAHAWHPFYSSSPSFSAHSTASIVSLQGKTPLSGHPKTLRDLSNASELLTLPSSFGAIQLGETFSSCICVNNEISGDVAGVVLRVEMQTASSKVTLAEIGGLDYPLAAQDTVETVVQHEIKELGQHVLACTVSYFVPDLPPGAPEEKTLTFRKFYKFNVTNPLSVKTKVHTPRAPSALMSATEREKVFLEVHIQNLTQDSMWFESMKFECTDGWQLAGDETNVEDVVGKGKLNLLQPQDMRQYIYILTKIEIPSFPIIQAPGDVIGLGRLDISWRSSYGEPGRLLTSMLSRRIPPPPAPPQPQPASAVPPYLQRTSLSNQSGQPRPSSPALPTARPGSPSIGPIPYRPASPSLRRQQSAAAMRPQSPGAVNPLASPTMPFSPTNALGVLPLPPSLPIEVDVVISSLDHDSIKLEHPFQMTLKLTVRGAIPKTSTKRTLSLVAQHLLPSPSLVPAVTAPPPEPEALSPRLPSSGFSTPSPTMTPTRGMFNFTAAEQKLLHAPPRRQATWDTATKATTGVVLPSPVVNKTAKNAKVGAAFVGMSTLELAPFVLEPSSDDTKTADDNPHVKGQASQTFTLTYMPLRKGFVTTGGLRILLVEDKTESEDKESSKSEAGDDATLVDGRSTAETSSATAEGGSDFERDRCRDRVMGEELNSSG